MRSKLTSCLLPGVLLLGGVSLVEAAQVKREGRPPAEREGRRSPEAEAGPRRSPEAEADPRRKAEENALRGFRPQTQREQELYRMVLQLQREVEALRREVRGGRGESRGSEGSRDTVVTDLAPGWERTKAGGVFRTYDKDRNGSVSLDEWLAMTNGNASPARRKLQTERFQQAGAGRDLQLSPAEFVAWWNGRNGNLQKPRTREGGRSPEAEAGPRRSPEAEAGPRRQRERE